MSSVYKQSRRKNGKQVRARNYTGKYKCPLSGVWKTVALGVTDKRVAEKKLADLIRSLEEEAVGLAPPKLLRESATRPIAEHIGEFIDDLRMKNRSREHYRRVEQRLGILCRECDWNFIRDVTADSFQTWRTRQDKAAKTLNGFLSAARSFVTWMERAGRVAANPLRTVEAVDTRGRETFERRALTSDEVRRLLEVAGPRLVVYLAAVHTGLRHGELRSLKWGDVHLDAPAPFIVVRASTSKNRKKATIWLVDELADELRRHRPAVVDEGAKVFDRLVPSRSTWAEDFRRAGIERDNARGRADFHALRHTLASNLAARGVPMRFAMEHMRHSDIKLTSKVYTDASTLPIAEAVDTLPRYLSDPDESGGAHIGAQTQDAGCHVLSPTGTDGVAMDADVNPLAQRNRTCHGTSCLSQSNAGNKVEPGGIEPTENGGSEDGSGGGAHIGAQETRPDDGDEHLRKLLRHWPGLPDDQKAIVADMVRDVARGWSDD